MRSSPIRAIREFMAISSIRTSGTMLVIQFRNVSAPFRNSPTNHSAARTIPSWAAAIQFKKSDISTPFGCFRA